MSQLPTGNQWLTTNKFECKGSKAKTSLSAVLLLTNYIFLYILKDALISFRAVLLVSRIVCTVPCVPWHYTVLQIKNRTLNFQICHLLRSDKKLSDEIFHWYPCTTRARNSDLATVFIDPEHVIQRGTFDMGAKILSFETPLMERAIRISKEMDRCLWNAGWLCKETRRLTKAWLVLSLRVAPTLFTNSCIRYRNPS